MTASFSQYSIFQQLTSSRVVSTSNLAGSYNNGVLNNGVGATLIANSVGALVIDSVSLSNSDRVLLVAQTNGNENGIYVVTDAGGVAGVWVLTRSADQQNIEQMKAGQFLSIDAGTVNAGSMYVLVEPLPFELGIDDINFESVQSPGGGSATFTDLTVTGVATFANEGIHILDTNASHDLVIKAGSDLTADRILTITTGDAARTLDISAANVTVSTFGASLVDDASAAAAATTLELGTASDVSFASVTVGNTGLHVLDTNASHDLIIVPGSDLTADRTLSIITSDVNRTINISAANLTLSSFGATLANSASNLAAMTSLGIKRGTTAAYGGGGTSNAFVATGLVATDIVVATILASSNSVSIASAVPTADTLTITFSADPGAATTVQWIAIATV